jgi:hypothetical protein
VDIVGIRRNHPAGGTTHRRHPISRVVSCVRISMAPVSAPVSKVIWQSRTWINWVNGGKRPITGYPCFGCEVFRSSAFLVRRSPIWNHAYRHIKQSDYCLSFGSLIPLSNIYLYCLVWSILARLFMPFSAISAEPYMKKRPATAYGTEQGSRRVRHSLAI